MHVPIKSAVRNLQGILYTENIQLNEIVVQFVTIHILNSVDTFIKPDIFSVYNALAICMQLQKDLKWLDCCKNDFCVHEI